MRADWSGQDESQHKFNAAILPGVAAVTKFKYHQIVQKGSLIEGGQIPLPQQTVLL